MDGEQNQNIVKVILTIIGAISALLGAGFVYKRSSNKSLKQTQKAGDNSQQIQQGSGNITIHNHKDDK